MFIMPIPNNFSKLESSELQALNSNFFWVLFFAAFGKRPGNASATAVAFGLDDITTWVDNTFWDRKGSLCEFLEPEHIRWKFRIRIFWCIPWAGRFQDSQKGIGSLWNWTMATTSLANCVKVQIWNRIVQYLCSESILSRKCPAEEYTMVLQRHFGTVAVLPSHPKDLLNPQPELHIKGN